MAEKQLFDPDEAAKEVGTYKRMFKTVVDKHGIPYETVKKRRIYTRGAVEQVRSHLQAWREARALYKEANAPAHA